MLEIVNQQNHFPREIEQVQADIHDAIENSREMVRQSRLLLELTDADGPGRADNDNIAL